MALGDAQAWSSRFISLDDRLLERVAAVWAGCVAVLGAQPDEDTITINLVHALNKDPVVRRICYWIEYQFEPFGTNTSGAKFSKGKIDVAVFLDRERDRYLAYECKRLNVVHSGKRSSLATEYVVNGMMRFLTEQYAEQLPTGCMLGYVMDGDMGFASAQLTAAIKAHAPLKQNGTTTALPALQSFSRFSSSHQRSTAQTIDLRHALLPYK